MKRIGFIVVAAMALAQIFANCSAAEKPTGDLFIELEVIKVDFWVLKAREKRVFEVDLFPNHAWNAGQKFTISRDIHTDGLDARNSNIDVRFRGPGGLETATTVTDIRSNEITINR